MTTLRCANPFCREVARTGRAQFLGEVADVPGAEAHLHCQKCNGTTHWRSSVPAPLATPRRSAVFSQP